MSIVSTVRNRHPPTHLQERWIVQYSPERYRRLHLVSAIRCIGHLDFERFRGSLERVVARHDILRAVVERDEGGAVWIHVADRHEVALRELQIKGGDIQHAVDEFRIEPFNISSGPLFRFAVARVDDHQSICVLVFHHAIADGWSLGVFWSDVLQHYDPSPEASQALQERRSPALQFTEVMRGRSEWLSSTAAELARAYWTRRFAACTDPVVLPEAPSASPDARLPPISGSLGVEDCERLARAARRASVSFSSAVMGAFAVLLSSWGKGTDVVTWVCHTGRRRRDAMKSIGCFLDMWLLSVRIDADASLLEAVSAVHAASIEALPALDLPGAEVGKVFSNVRAGSRLPVTVFNFIPTPAEGGRTRTGGGALITEPIGVAKRERYMPTNSGLSIFASVRWDKSILSWDLFFDPAFFDDGAIERASEFFGRVLRCIGAGDTAQVPAWKRCLDQP